MRIRIVIVMASVAVAPLLASAQVRRSAPPGGGGPPDAPAGARVRGAANARFPFAGTWEGSITMKEGPGKEPRSIGMTFDVTDSAKKSYSGFTIYTNNARAPHLNSVAANDSLRWEQSNSGGGRWVYAARLVSIDSIEGTLTLNDAPWHPATKPHGTFVMARRSATTSMR